MKKSDMKAIAIILAIGLFFTVFTSNAVSVASVVLLLGNESSASNAPADNTNTNPQGNNTIATNGNTAVTPSNGTANTTADNSNASSNSNTGAASADANKPADNGSQNATADNNTNQNSAIDKEALKMYQDAAKAIKNNAVAGHSKKTWQAVTEDLHLDQLESLSGRLSEMIESFMTAEADAEVLVSEKGSEEAKSRFPASNCTEDSLVSVKKEESGSNYIITIVMKDQLNPGLEDTDGVTVMTNDLLYIKYVTDTIESNGFVNALVKELTKGDITYKNFTIVATMTKDGKFLEIKQDVDGYIDAAAETLFGEVSGTGAIGFHIRYFDFKY